MKAGDKKFALKDYANWNGMRVGMIRRNSRNDDLAGFAAQKGFSYSTVYFDDTASMVKSLKTGGEIDLSLIHIFPRGGRSSARRSAYCRRGS